MTEMERLKAEVDRQARELVDVNAQLVTERAAHGDACKLVADMHAAAVGEIRGPIRAGRPLRAPRTHRQSGRRREVSAPDNRESCEYCGLPEFSDSGLCKTHLAAYRRGAQAGIAEERARVIAWLRDPANTDVDDRYEHAASVFERADHLTTTGASKHLPGCQWFGRRCPNEVHGHGCTPDTGCDWCRCACRGASGKGEK